MAAWMSCHCSPNKHTSITPVNDRHERQPFPQSQLATLDAAYPFWNGARWMAPLSLTHHVVLGTC
jgi:hypothetical protein